MSKRPFTISSLLDLEEMPQLEREDLLPTEPTEQTTPKRRRSNSSEPNSQEADLVEHNNPKFYNILGESRSTNRRYRGARYVATYTFQELEQSTDPEAILKQIIQRHIDEVQKTARESNINPDSIIVIISSQQLDWDIRYHIQQINEDSVNQIFNEFNRIDQSNKQKEGRGSLYGDSFRIDMLAFSRSELRKTAKTTKGKPKHKGGNNKRVRHITRNLRIRQSTTHPGGNRRRLRPLSHNINENGIYRIDNSDNFCLFRAIVLLIARDRLHQRRFSEYRQDEAQILSDVIDLLESAGISKTETEYAIEDYGDAIQRYLNREYPNKFKLFAFSDVGYYKPFYESDAQTFKTPICVYYHDHHYDAIRTIKSFFSNIKNYCFNCLQSYDRPENHSLNCKARCLNCGVVDYSRGPCQSDGVFHESCTGCDKTFNNSECYEEHLRKLKKYNFCDKSKKCVKCGVIYRKEHTKEDGHKCGEIFCHKCLGYHKPNRGCFMTPLDKPKDEDYRLVIFDFEATQDYQPNPNILRYEHKVNFASATVVCTRCIVNNTWKDPLREECDICGTTRTHAWAMADFTETAFDYKDICAKPLENFVEWLLYSFNKGEQKKFETIALSHYGGRYDMTMIFAQLFKLGGVKPSIVRQGNKLYEIKVQKKGQLTKTTFRDTYNIMPVNLGGLIDCFGLKNVENKQFFPHMFNKKTNLDVELPNLPTPNDYLYRGMSVKKRDEFMKWYFANRKSSFVLKERLAEYCASDVKILLHAVVEMQRLFKELTSLDVFRSKTIASAVMKHFRVNHLKKWNLAIIPENGYEAHYKQSKIACKYLKWYAHKNNVTVQTSESPEGEKKCGKYLLDGFVKNANGRDLAIEINGCYWHACKTHYPDPEMIVANGETAQVVRQYNDEKERFIRKHYDLKVIWECQINELLKTEPGMKEFFERKFDSSAIVLRDAFFGGRVGPEKIHAEAVPGETKICYLDFQSLYPSRQYEEMYPLGHPVATHVNKFVKWTSSADNEYRGIIKCLVEPPRFGLPVLPHRIENDSRLLFPLCKRCATENKIGKKCADYNCKHFEIKDRWFVTTTTHLELNAALDVGYKVHKIYRVLTWPANKWSDSVFKGYIKEFLQIKLEASGWPSSCKDEAFPNDPLPHENSPTLTEKEREIIRKLLIERQSFVQETKDRYGFNLQLNKMKWNPGLRYIAKLALNSLWGRFALRNNLSKTVIVDSPSDFIKYLDDYRIEVTNIDQLNEEAIMLSYTDKAEFISEHASSNLVVSIFTTSAARVHLLKALQMVQNSRFSEILYMDTDSIIYKYLVNPNEEADFEYVRRRREQYPWYSWPERSDPLYYARGKHLGELSDEYPDHEILEFLSGGCKNYMLRIKKKSDPDAKDQYVNKIRGITFDHNTCRKLTFDEYKKRVLDLGNEEVPLQLQYNRIQPDKFGHVTTRPISKNFRCIVTKGIILDDDRVVPFGYSDPCNDEIRQLHAEVTERNNRFIDKLRDRAERIRQQNT